MKQRSSTTILECIVYCNELLGGYRQPFRRRHYSSHPARAPLTCPQCDDTGDSAAIRRRVGGVSAFRPVPGVRVWGPGIRHSLRSTTQRAAGATLTVSVAMRPARSGCDDAVNERRRIGPSRADLDHGAGRGTVHAHVTARRVCRSPGERQIRADRCRALWYPARGAHAPRTGWEVRKGRGPGRLTTVPRHALRHYKEATVAAPALPSPPSNPIARFVRSICGARCLAISTHPARVAGG